MVSRARAPAKKTASVATGTQRRSILLQSRCAKRLIVAAVPMAKVPACLRADGPAGGGYHRTAAALAGVRTACKLFLVFGALRRHLLVRMQRRFGIVIAVAVTAGT